MVEKSQVKTEESTPQNMKSEHKQINFNDEVQNLMGQGASILSKVSVLKSLLEASQNEITLKIDSVNDAIQGVIRCIEHQNEVKANMTSEELDKFASEASHLLDQHKSIFLNFEDCLRSLGAAATTRLPTMTLKIPPPKYTYKLSLLTQSSTIVEGAEEPQPTQQNETGEAIFKNTADLPRYDNHVAFFEPSRESVGENKIQLRSTYTNILSANLEPNLFVFQDKINGFTDFVRIENLSEYQIEHEEIKNSGNLQRRVPAPRIKIVASFPVVFENVIQHEDRIICDHFVYDAMTFRSIAQINLKKPISTGAPFYQQLAIFGHNEYAQLSLCKWTELKTKNAIAEDGTPKRAGRYEPIFQLVKVAQGPTLKGGRPKTCSFNQIRRDIFYPNSQSVFAVITKRFLIHIDINLKMPTESRKVKIHERHDEYIVEYRVMVKEPSSGKVFTETYDLAERCQREDGTCGFSTEGWHKYVIILKQSLILLCHIEHKYQRATTIQAISLQQVDRNPTLILPKAFDIQHEPYVFQMAHVDQHAFNLNTAAFKSTAGHTSRMEATDEDEQPMKTAPKQGQNQNRAQWLENAIKQGGADFDPEQEEDVMQAFVQQTAQPQAFETDPMAPTQFGSQQLFVVNMTQRKCDKMRESDALSAHTLFGQPSQQQGLLFGQDQVTGAIKILHLSLNSATK